MRSGGGEVKQNDEFSSPHTIYVLTFGLRNTWNILAQRPDESRPCGLWDIDLASTKKAQNDLPLLPSLSLFRVPNLSSEFQCQCHTTSSAETPVGNWNVVVTLICFFAGISTITSFCHMCNKNNDNNDSTIIFHIDWCDMIISQLFTCIINCLTSFFFLFCTTFG